MIIISVIGKLFEISIIGSGLLFVFLVVSAFMRGEFKK